MTAGGAIRVCFLVILVISAIVAFGCGLFVSKKKYKNNDATRNLILMRIRSICFLIMLVSLLIMILVKK